RHELRVVLVLVQCTYALPEVAYHVRRTLIFTGFRQVSRSEAGVADECSESGFVEIEAAALRTFQHEALVLTEMTVHELRRGAVMVVPRSLLFGAAPLELRPRDVAYDAGKDVLDFIAEDTDEFRET